MRLIYTLCGKLNAQRENGICYLGILVLLCHDFGKPTVLLP